MVRDQQTRRQFLERMAGGIAVGAVSALPHAGSGLLAEPKAGMEYRTLGRSGEKVSMVGLGGYHIGIQPDEQESIRIIRTGLDNGINFLDNCWDYNGGTSEVRMGKALKDGYRQRAFLMTKIDGQTREAAARQLDESLTRLQTDHIDLLQFHEVIREGDPDRIFGPHGGMEAALAARKAGKIRYIGFTGHKDPEIHLKMLNTGFRNGFTFDAVQMPLNVMDAHYKSFGKKVVPVLVQHGIGVLGMKPMGSGIILKSNTVTPVECLHYAMSLPTSVVITGCDSLLMLNQALEAARTFKPLSAAETATLLAKTEKAAADGQYEPFKTTTSFDATNHDPKLLG